MQDNKIDIVVTWVDGNDPEWQKDKAKYDPNVKDNSATDNRFRDWDLMKYWFRGIEKYAPWVNHVYMITVGHYPKWLDLSNPKFTLIKHSDYIPHEILPTFNANPIEMHINRIKELSEQFVLFNDDCFLINHTTPEDFFKNGLPCESGLLGILSATNPGDVFPHIMVNNNAIINKHFVKRDVLKNNKGKFFNTAYGKDIVRNIALLPFVYFSDFRDLHLPTSHLKSLFDEVWNAEPEAVAKGSSARFRSKDDISHWLIKDWYMCKGQFEPRSPKWGKKFELGVDDGEAEYIANQQGKVVCLNDSTDDLDFETIQRSLIDAFEKILPEKSGFEL